MKPVVLAIFFIGLLGFNVFGQEAKLMLPIGHTNDVTYCQFFSDGKKVITAADDGTIKIWDAKAATLLADIHAFKNPVFSVVLSPDEKRFVAASGYDPLVKVFNVATGQLLVTLTGHKKGVKELDFSPDGKQIVTASDDNTARLWDSGSGILLGSFTGHLKAVNSIKFSCNGKKIVTASSDKTIKIWDVRTKTVYKNFKSVYAPNVALFSPDGKKIITISKDKIVLIWDAATGKLLKQLIGHNEEVNSALFSPDGQKIVTAAKDSTAKIWDAQTGKLLIDLKGHIGVIKRALFSPDGRKILTASVDQTAKVWDVESGKLLTTLRGHTDTVECAGFSPDGKKIVSGSADRTAKIWDSETGKLLINLTGHTREVNFSEFSPNGKILITASDDKTTKLWDFETGKLLTNLTGHTGLVESAKFSPNGKLIVTASDDSTIRIWDVKTRKQLMILRGHTDNVNSAEFSPDESKILSASDDKTAKIWDKETGNLLFTLKGHTGGLYEAEFSPIGIKIATASVDSTVKVWDAKTGKILIDLKGHTSAINSVEFSPDGKEIVTTSRDKSAKIWDAETGQLIMIFSHKDVVTDAQFSSDGKSIITASNDYICRILNVKNGKLIRSLVGHTDCVNTARFSTDNKYVVTSSQDNTCKIWDAASGKLRYTFFAVDSTDYLVTDPYGRYDGTEGARKLLYFTCGTEVIGLDQVKDQLWVPNLAERIMKGDSINAKKLSDLDICGLIPHVEKEDKSGYHFIITPQRGGLGETVVYVNGIEEKRYKPKQLTKTATRYKLDLDEKELVPYFISGQQNSVTVKAYTANNDISSRGAEIIKDETQKQRVAPNLYAVMIGVSDYKGPELQLKYAAKDAEDISAAISASAKKLLDTTGGKEHVFMYNLTTGKNRYVLPEKIAVKNIFGEIGKKATANDILLIFFAGHGVTSGEKKTFYFLTADASRSSATDAPAEVGISTKELSAWMQPSNIKAQKRILILDACNSGQAINELVKVGSDGQNYLAARNDDRAEQIKAIDKLNEKSGLFILAASASNQSAYEMGRYSQGLLTYSLLKAIKQQPDILEDNKYLNVSRWFNAAEKTVSDMVRETGNRQEPQIVSAGNFNIGVVDQEVMAGIKLADEKPLFTASKFLDVAIEDDDLDLSSLIDQSMNEISSRGGDSQISYVTASASPDAWSLSGGYDIKGDEISVKVNIKQNKEIKTKLELTGRKSELKALAEKVVNEAADWILKKK